jgi:GNAT superfamily N-acetyltransferase
MASVLSISPSTTTFSATTGSRGGAASPTSSVSSASLGNHAGPAGPPAKKEQHDSLVPPHWQDTVREIGISECRQAGLSLSHAFAADDLSKYLLDASDMAHYSDETRWKLHILIMTGIVAAHCYKGIVATIGPDYDAVALWLPPGKDLDDWWTIFRSGLWRLTYKLSREGRRRYYDELLPILHDTKLEVMGDRDNDCYYLVYLGTKPSARRKGYAGKLLEDMITRVSNSSPLLPPLPPVNVS